MGIFGDPDEWLKALMSKEPPQEIKDAIASLQASDWLLIGSAIRHMKALVPVGSGQRQIMEELDKKLEPIVGYMRWPSGWQAAPQPDAPKPEDKK